MSRSAPRHTFITAVHITLVPPFNLSTFPAAPPSLPVSLGQPLKPPRLKVRFPTVSIIRPKILVKLTKSRTALLKLPVCSQPTLNTKTLPLSPSILGQLALYLHSFGPGIQVHGMFRPPGPNPCSRIHAPVVCGWRFSHTTTTPREKLASPAVTARGPWNLSIVVVHSRSILANQSIVPIFGRFVPSTIQTCLPGLRGASANLWGFRLTDTRLADSLELLPPHRLLSFFFRRAIPISSTWRRTLLPPSSRCSAEIP